jgi:alpha-tubulin suppressor-like RCC1 family protein
MAIQSASAKLYTGIRCWCVDKNIKAALVSTFSLGNKNRPIDSGNTVYPNVLAARLIRTVVDIESASIFSLTNERYKTYGFKSDIKSKSTFLCKFPTYIRIDLEKLQLPEGVTCTISFEEGWITDGEYIGSTKAASAPVNNFFTFRTPWYSGRLKLSSLFTQALTYKNFRPFSSNISSLFTPVVSAKITKRGVEDMQSAFILSTKIGKKQFVASSMNSRFGPIGPGDIPYLEGNGYAKDTGLGSWPAGFPGIVRIRSSAVSTNAMVSTLSLPDFLVVWLSYAYLTSTSTMATDGFKYKGVVNERVNVVSAMSIAPVKTAISGPAIMLSYSYLSLPVIGRKKQFAAAIQPVSSMSITPTKITPSLVAAGLNTKGQLGLGDTTQRTSFTQIGINWTSFASGDGHSAGIKNGELYTWGSNDLGEAGQGVTGGQYTTPTKVGTDTDWVEVSLGSRFGIARKSNGTIWGWGYNGYGQLGQGNYGSGTNLNVPTQIGSSTNWTKVSCGTSHILALNSSNQLYVWGDNNVGQTGLGYLNGGFIRFQTTTPTRLGSASNWTFVNAGLFSSFAINSSGQLYSWGDNTSSQLGFSTSPDSNGHKYEYTPVLVSTGGWTQISTGGNNGGTSGYAGDVRHTLAIRYGQLWVVGGNNWGQLGLGDTTDRTTFTQVGSDSNWTSVSTGQIIAHSAAIKDNKLYTWGSNQYGQLGQGDTNNRSSPTQVGTNPFWTAVSCGRYHTLAQGPAYV